MDPSALVVSVLASSVSSVVPALRAWLAREGNRELSVQMGDKVVELSSLDPDDQEKLVRTFLDRIERAEDAEGLASVRQQPEQAPKDRSRVPSAAALKEPATVPSSVAGASLTFAPEVFSDARRRIALMFKVNIVLSVVLGVILIGALIACIVLAVSGRTAWSVIFGGVSAADVLGIYMFKPLSAVSNTVVASQRLEVIHLRLQEQLRSCGDIDDVDRRIECQTKVWDVIQRELAALAAVRTA